MVRVSICKSCNSEYEAANSEGLNYCSKCYAELSNRTHEKQKKINKSSDVFVRDSESSEILYDEDFFEGTIGLREELNTDFGHWGHYY
ncbi:MULTISPECIES: hypothetical protein [Bhargavaea]|uniref:Uncharacterized protein n=1 Tax=Bhargavaea changchunensis TaxID=2134037 RepID=A0ABW2N9I0_9BACL|nr:hypothetical protein [Bhargavaea sp. CC-171006]